MTPAQIHKHFEHLLRTGPDGFQQRRAIGMSAGQASWYRWRLRHQKSLSLKTMLRWLKLAGADVGLARSYSAADMQAFARWCSIYNNREARKLGYAYLLEKWEAGRLSP